VTLHDWLARLEALHPQGIDGIELGLARVTELKQRLGQTESVPMVLVAGTNGKGSTCAMLESIWRSAGYRVGLYSSPHLLRFNERIRINHGPVDDAILIHAFERVEAARGEIALTYFEFVTLAAWEVFASNALDVIILEVGLGGRLDATNIYTPSCSVLTTIDLDHMAFLGTTREAIGREKAGIFRAGVPAICGDPSPPQSVLDHAAALGTPLAVMGRDFGFARQEQQWRYIGQSSIRNSTRNGLAFPGLRGQNQLLNASTALATVDALRECLPVAMQDIRLGLLTAEIPGRFQVLPGQPSIVLDVAHNSQSMRALASNLGDMAFHPRTWGVFGMLADKDLDDAIVQMKERITHWLPCTLPSRRTTSADLLYERLKTHGITPVKCFDSPAQALRFAQSQAVEADRIVAFGSFLTVAGALEHLGRTG
jgi:dihydrofolate synthase / folylpolyglutamate synthase